MRSSKWLAALFALLVCGLIAAGCGDDDDTTTTAAETTTTEATTSDDTTAEATTSDDTTAEDTTTDETTTVESGEGSASADDVYNACIDVIEGTPAESAGRTACEQARDAFEQCSQQAESESNDQAREIAIQVCQEIADRTTEALQAGS